jgi:hemerythrin-like metal-binding protein
VAFFDWNDTYSVSVKQMDDQHRRLFDLINEFYEGIARKKTKESVEKMLQGLLDYTRYHFGDEEKLMLENNYLGYKEQKTQHDYFIATVLDYQKRIAEGRLLLSVEITNFLKDWLVKHIQGKDRQYGPFLNAKGVR